MSGKLSILKFEFNDNKLDVIVIRGGEENEPYFFASKVAETLGYKNVQQAIRVNCRKVVNVSQFVEGCYAVAPLSELTNIQPHTALIPESDVYRLVMKSKNPEAVKFQDFICDVVLKSIRKHGTYPPPLETESSVPAIGYNIGVHEDRMKHFETLDDEERKEMRKETLTETNSLKSEQHVNAGSIGGSVRQQNIRNMEEENNYLIVKDIINDLVNTVVDSENEKEISRLRKQNHALNDTINELIKYCDENL